MVAAVVCRLQDSSGSTSAQHRPACRLLALSTAPVSCHLPAARNVPRSLGMVLRFPGLKKKKNQGNFRRPHPLWGRISSLCLWEPLDEMQEGDKSQHTLPRGKVVLMQGHGDASLPAPQLAQNVGLQG